MIDVLLKRFETPDDVRKMEKGRFELVTLVRRRARDRAHARPLFHIPAEPHDSWVIGDTPYVSLHFLGADHYAKTT